MTGKYQVLHRATLLYDGDDEARALERYGTAARRLQRGRERSGRARYLHDGIVLLQTEARR